MTNPPRDLSELIDAASREVSRTRATPSRPAAKRRPLVVPALAVAALLAAAGLLWFQFKSPSVSRVQRDLEAAVDSARQSIETVRSSNGALPPALPNAALAQVVGYAQEANGYRLVATMMGVRVTMELDGSKRIDTAP